MPAIIVKNVLKLVQDEHTQKYFLNDTSSAFRKTIWVRNNQNIDPQSLPSQYEVVYQNSKVKNTTDFGCT